MGRFTINLEAASSFYVIKKDPVDTGGSMKYVYEIYATNGDNIDLSITGEYQNAKLYQGVSGTPSVYSDGTYVFDRYMTVEFTIPNSSLSGEFKSSTLVFQNLTVPPSSYNEYNETIINYNDGPSSGSGLSWKTSEW